MTTPSTSTRRQRKASPHRAPVQHRPVAAAPLVLALHWGLTVGGVTTWGVRLVNEMARRGRTVTLILHRGESECASPDYQIDDRVRVVDLRHLPRLQATGGDVSPFLPAYREAVRRCADERGGPVVLNPNIFEECFGIAAALCQEDPEAIRVAAWQHNDNEYDAQVLARYEPILSRIAGVSTHICATLRGRLPYRASDIVHLPYGLPIPRTPVEREPLGGRPVRLLYAGRMERTQKRATALVHMVDELARRGVEHELLLVGDGEAAAEIDAMLALRPTVRRLPAASPGEVIRHMDRADAYVLASRYEGLCIAMLEALSRGCVPIVTNVKSGAAEAVDPGVNGELAPGGFELDEHAVGQHLADAVDRFLAGRPGRMSIAAWETARSRYSLERHADAAVALIDAAAAGPSRRWPASWPVTFDGTLLGAVPPEGLARARALLESLRGRSVVVHGVGRHTLDLGRLFAQSPARIVGFTDDDPARHGGTLWNWPVVAPAQAARTGATDVVISSRTFQEAIWGRRAVYESQGMRVHRIYDGHGAGLTPTRPV